MNIKKILIIFLFAFLMAILIYKKYDIKEIRVLIIGEKLDIYKYTDYFKYNYNSDFIEDNVTYKKLINYIENNKNIYKKGNRLFLNQLILDSDIIIINSNYNNYKMACNKNRRILEEYIDREFKYYLELKNKISHITNAKIIVIGNYCDNKKIKELYKNDNYININELKKINNIDTNKLIYNEINVLIKQK